MSVPSHVTLVSNDGFEFVISRSAACGIPTVQRMLDAENGFIESQTNVCRLAEVSGIVLEKICEYLYYAEKYRDAKEVPVLDVPAELSLLLLAATDYLQMV